MATFSSVDPAHDSQASPFAQGGDSLAKTLICLPSMTADELAATLQAIASAFAALPLAVATPDHGADSDFNATMRLLCYERPGNAIEWVIAPNDYVTANSVAKKLGAQTILLLGEGSLPVGLFVQLAESVKAGADFVVPRYSTSPSSGLVNSALLYPVTRGLFGADIRFPLPLNAAMSQRALERLAAAAQKRAPAGGGNVLLWPVPELSLAGFRIQQVDAGERTLPQPREGDFNTLFTSVAGSLFTDVEAKASFWQRPRIMTASSTAAVSTGSLDPVSDDVQSMVEGFHLAYTNLHELWSLVLPPQTLLALKRLSQAAPEAFTIHPNLWARIVYDFALAFRLRTINRGHLLGALTPLYLAWVASHLRSAGEDADHAAQLIEEGAIAFEAEKPYLVARWRWPDRFNP